MNLEIVPVNIDDRYRRTLARGLCGDRDGPRALAAMEITNLYRWIEAHAMAKSKAAADFSSFVRSKKAADGAAPATAKTTNTVQQKLAACRVSRAQWERLQHLCIAEDTSVQAVVSEALADWFKKRRLPW